MSPLELAILALIAFATGVVSVITGATSLITVPALMLFGVEPRVAIAPNMLALTFLSAGATIPFMRGDAIDWERASTLIALTVVSSIAGALLVFALPEEVLPLIIATMMLVIAAFVLLRPHAGLESDARPSPRQAAAGYAATLLLGVYGGFFSGGYVTLLTTAWIAFFRMPFRRSIATTKLINTASSLTAVLVFAWQGVIDWPLGLLLSFVMFISAMLGARITLRLDDRWLRRVFLAVVIVLALKTLALDVPWARVLWFN